MARTPPVRTAGQRPLIALVAIVVLAVGATAIADELGDSEATDGQQPATSQAMPSPSPEPGRTAEVVGPARDADVEEYIEGRTAALLEAPSTVDTAIVSFSEALSAADARNAIGEAGSVRALLYRVPLEQAAPRTLRVGAADDPAAALDAELERQVEPLRREQAAAQEYLEGGTVDDEEFLADYERRVAEIDDALAAIEDGSVVHAVVVRGSLDELQSLADATAVRLVDPAPPGTDLALSVFHGLLPSDTDTVSHGQAA